MRLGVSCLAVAVLLSTTAPGFALESKQCLPMAQMNEALKAERQKVLIMGDRAVPVDDNTQVGRVRIDRWVNIFTSNPDGSLGYNIEGDKPMGQVSTRACVAAKLTNIRLYDRRRAGTPSETRRGGEFDAMLIEDEKRGTRPMLQADSISTGPDGKVRQGLGITLMGNPGSRAAFLIANYPAGGLRDMFQMSTTDYTAEGESRLTGQ